MEGTESLLATPQTNYNGGEGVDISSPEEARKRIKKILVSGVGFFSDAYDLFIINIVMVIIGRDHHIKDSDKSAISSAALIGAIIGQIFFGLLADRIGRKKGFIATLTLVVLGAILSTLSFEYKFITIFISLAFFRMVLGVGIGGEYPLSATITSESATTQSRGRMVSAVFSMQGIGSLIASLVGLILIIALKDNFELMWRLALGIGAVPGLLSMYFRITMEETGRFLKKHETVSFVESFKTYGLTLLGTAGCWFLLDVTFYANGLFSATVLELFDVGNTDDDESDAELRSIAEFNVYLALMALPGYWIGVFMVDLPWFGRKRTQLFGFLLLALNYLGIGLFYHTLKKSAWAFILLYGLTFFITNAGPNTTTFVIPSEAFPTNIRATYHGISAASGKAGAALGALGMAPILDAYGLPLVLFICSGVALAGAILTFFTITETKGKSLEDVDRSRVAYQKL